MAENYQKLSKVRQVELLETTVVKGAPEEVTEILKKLGKVEISARALGIACRFKGLEWVKALINGGARFSFWLDGAAETKYDCSNHNLFEAMLLDHITDFNRTAPLFVQGNHTEYLMEYRNMEEETESWWIEDGTVLFCGGQKISILPQKERLSILKWLLESQNLDGEKLLFYSMLEENNDFTELLLKHGVKIPESIIYSLTTGKGGDFTWFDWMEYVRQRDVKKTITSFRKIAKCLDGKKILITNSYFQDTSTRDGFQYKKYDNQCLCTEFIQFAFSECDCAKLNKRDLAEYAIDKNDVAIITALANAEAFKTPSVREALIEKAQSGNHMEILAFLLDFKNKKVDIQKETKNREKKEMRELTQSPTSAASLRKVWSVKENEDGTLCLTNYKGEGNVRSSTVAVPETIGKKVVTRLEGTFDCFKDLKEITLPGTIIEIGMWTFRQCCNLERCNAPQNLKTIGERAFEGCSSLKEFEIPPTVEIIGSEAFEGCKSLTHVTIPSGVKRIKTNTFRGCTSLEKVVIPDSVGEIGYNAFGGCIALADVSMNNDEITIDKHAFDQVPWYDTQETIEKGVRYRGSVVVGFDKCVPEEIEFRPGTTTIGKGAFGSCKSITKVVLPEGVEKIEDNAFYGCKNLQVIQLPNSLKVIANSAFYGCGNLITVLGSRKDIKVAMDAFWDTPIPNLSHPNITDYSPNIVNKVYNWLRTTGTVWDHKEELEEYVAAQYKVLLDAISAKEDSSALYHLCKIIDQLMRSGQKTDKELVSEFEVRLFHSSELMRVFEEYLAQWVQILGADRQIKGKQLLQAITMSEADAKKLFKVSKAGLPEGECAISGYKGTDSLVVIPAMIGNNKVVEIREGAFYVPFGKHDDPCQYVSRVYIPETVRRITKKTFSGCRNLNCIFVPDSVEEVSHEFGKQSDRFGFLTLFVVKDSIVAKQCQKLKENWYARWDGEFNYVTEYPYMSFHN